MATGICETPVVFCEEKLSDYLIDRIRPFHPDKAFIQASVKIGQIVWIQAEESQDGGVQSTNVETVNHGLTTQFVGFSNAYAAFDPSSGHPHGEPVGIVIPPCAAGIFGSGLTPEFTTPDNKGFIEQTSLFEILE